MLKKNHLFIFLLSLVSYFHFICAEEMTISNVTVSVMGKSGKIKIFKKSENLTEQIEEEVNIRFGSLSEKDENGTEVGKAGPIKHSFNNFAQLDFSVTPITPILFQNISAYHLNLTASNLIKADTTFKAMIYIFNETGTIDIGGDDRANVGPGMVKFSAMIENWVFCKNSSICQDDSCCEKGGVYEIGSYLDFDLEILGNKNASSIKSTTYDLGNSKLILAKNSLVDNQTVAMPEGYPTFSHKDDKDVFTLRFPIFEQNVIYDPIIRLNSTPEPRNNYDGEWWIILLVVGSVLVIAGLGLIYWSCKKKDQENLL